MNPTRATPTIERGRGRRRALRVAPGVLLGEVTGWPGHRASGHAEHPQHRARQHRAEHEHADHGRDGAERQQLEGGFAVAGDPGGGGDDASGGDREAGDDTLEREV